MASKPITLVVNPRGKPIARLPQEATVQVQDSAAELYKRLSVATGCSVNRLRVTKGSDGSTVPDSKGVSIESTGLRDRSVIHVKDLGPQIAWRTVFIVEYLGPILIHPAVYFLRPYIYGSSSSTSPPASTIQTLSLALILAHFAKREFETIFIHRFSLSTMPAFNIFKNSAHYWILAGANIAYWTYAPFFSQPAYNETSLLPAVGLFLFTIGELGNLSTHLTLRSLRAEGSTARGIPTGWSFNLVTCPNYMFEVIAWIGIWLVNRSWSTGLFTVVAGVQMAVWAKKKERRYRRDFGDKYKKKAFAMLPGLI